MPIQLDGSSHVGFIPDAIVKIIALAIVRVKSKCKVVRSSNEIC